MQNYDAHLSYTNFKSNNYNKNMVFRIGLLKPGWPTAIFM